MGIIQPLKLEEGDEQTRPHLPNIHQQRHEASEGAKRWKDREVRHMNNRSLASQWLKKGNNSEVPGGCSYCPEIECGR
ncbi:hypothetical protein N015_15275 [Pseudomonas asturiensis]|uniref:Uncharacterized protein n=1 Tax=Pseudomonas asturiensis TaxID=1190415 RepID=A0ABX6HDM6_9PSED|nr:hypothetical protein [Pseudomonas asturiensis]QHF03699.1 hypothetical protein N015_15275 [Pseudomonas asturiensis]